MMREDLHLLKVEEISFEVANRIPGIRFIDVRSPSEFQDGAIPGAENIALLENAERETIGILYKNFGQPEAIREGYQLLKPKLEQLRNQFKSYENSSKTVAYCARGGLRSKVITSLLMSYGFKVCRLQGGYKAYRQWVLKGLDEIEFREPFLLCGQTGVGKTLVIERLDNALDLEGIAQHRGSLFGAVGKSPRKQKVFEGELFRQLSLLDLNRALFIEGESRKIGNLTIPRVVFEGMQKAKVILLEASIKTRTQRTIDEYIDEEGKNRPLIREIILKLKRSLGKDRIYWLVELFDRGEDHICFKYILENYYDRLYTLSLKGMNIMRRIDTEDIDMAVAELSEIAGNP
ncbi:MAG: tRNA 2-selenouridine(34) synthase MnmH [Deltaproteobacteria bacterium]|nr:tRNA 2-selenouridine(34) synthase MnmH [Deltaproteobacteria bacterium]